MAKIYLSTVGVLCLVSFINTPPVMGNSTPNQFEILAGMKIKEEFTYMDVPSYSVFQCASHCAMNTSCLSSSYNAYDRACFLSEYHVHGPQFQERLVVESSYTALSKNWCRAGWTNVGDTCYYFLQGNMNNTAAKLNCEQQGGQLAEPQTNVSFQMLRTYMVENLDFHRYWFGLYDEGDNDLFIWISSGTTPVYTDWADNEPDHWLGHDCVRLYRDSQYKWEDSLCGYNSGAVCE